MDRMISRIHSSLLGDQLWIVDERYIAQKLRGMNGSHVAAPEVPFAEYRFYQEVNIRGSEFYNPAVVSGDAEDDRESRCCRNVALQRLKASARYTGQVSHIYCSLTLRVSINAVRSTSGCVAHRRADSLTHERTYRNSSI